MRLRDSKNIKWGEKSYSVEHNKRKQNYRVVFTDQTGVYQSFENGRAMIFREKQRAETNASRFNYLYTPKKD